MLINSDRTSMRLVAHPNMADIRRRLEGRINYQTSHYTMPPENAHDKIIAGIDHNSYDK